MATGSPWFRPRRQLRSGPGKRDWEEGVSELQDWRLEVELDSADEGRGLDRLLHRVHGDSGRVESDVRSVVSHDVVVTHDGRLLFAYAAGPSALSEARRAIEDALRGDGHAPKMIVSHWNSNLDAWQRIDPPPDGASAPDPRPRDDSELTTRTLVCTAGKVVRETLEQSMLKRARELGVECSVVEHPHLLTTQVAFTVTGPRRKVNEFREALAAEGFATIRADSLLMNPL
jgi:hypothetical protein